jgi:hypothetical protein
MHNAFHLKGSYGGQLIFAVGSYPKEEYFPLAFAIVKAKAKNYWTWFLTLLIADIGEQRRLTFISHQQKE